MIYAARRARAAVLVAAVAVMVTAVMALAGCVGGAAGVTPPVSPPGTVGGDRGDLRVRGAYIPAETSPDVAAAYFSVTNTSAEPDTLVSVASPVSATVTVHETVTDGAVGSMREVASLVIPAHATVALSPGRRHIMLMDPSHPLRERDRVPLTVTFARAGALTLDVPVVAATGPVPAGRATS
jgi:periplasmic copper chaperone A